MTPGWGMCHWKYSFHHCMRLVRINRSWYMMSGTRISGTCPPKEICRVFLLMIGCLCN